DAAASAPGADTSQPASSAAPAAVSGVEAASARQHMQELGASGALGPILTQRLAKYLGKPVRCACEKTALAGQRISFHTRAGDVRLWLQMETSLASALADAMIGGEGDAAAVGFSARVARLASGAALELLRASADALGLAEPAALDEADAADEEPAVSGRLAIGREEHRWQAGVTLVEARFADARSAAARTGASRIISNVQTAAHERTGVEVALENARMRLSELVGAHVAFERQTVATRAHGHMPQGWIRLGVASREGGAAVLAVDRPAAVAIARLAAKDGTTAPTTGAVIEAGAEVVLRETLCALAASLGGGQEELHHVVRLGDDAIVADLPHIGIEHDVAWNGQRLQMHWLVPAHLVRPLTDRPGTPRGGR
ncbi:MAG: hypothetical protein JOZ28_04440, partial [Candidatus Eremiobacteraeota bacterium]|nr:hypothetical protein [Candidatus Eremiobacteraeota bacterium]